MTAAAAKPNDALRQPAPAIPVGREFVAADRTFCVYLPENEAVIRKRSELSGFPANTITEVRRTIDPTTANE